MTQPATLGLLRHAAEKTAAPDVLNAEEVLAEVDVSFWAHLMLWEHSPNELLVICV